MRKWAVIVFCHLIKLTSVSQPIFDYITTAHGLSSNKVMQVLQDKEGFYWIATGDGLNRFDGSSFKVFRHKKNDPASLVDNHCSGLAEDKEGNIWITTYKGISVFNKKENRFKNLKLEFPGINPDLLNRLSSIQEDKEGNIWVSAVGLWKYDLAKKVLIPYGLSVNKKDGILNNQPVPEIKYDAIHHGLWFSTSQGIFFFDITSQSFFNRNYNPPNWRIFSINFFSLLALGHDDRLWYYDTDKLRLCYFDISKNTITETQMRFLRAAGSMSVDENNKLWIGYYYGKGVIYDAVLQKADSSLFEKNHSRSALHSTFSGFYIDRKKNYWIYSSNGISILNTSRQYYSLYEIPVTGRVDYNQTHFMILAVAPGSDNRLWIGSSHGLYVYDLQTRNYRKIDLPLNKLSIRSIFLQGDSILWVASRYTVYKYDCRKDKVIAVIPFELSIQVITKTEDGKIWVGTWDSGVFRLNYDGTIEEYYSKESKKIPSNKLLCLGPNEFELWMGFNGGEGFASYDLKKNNFLYPEINIGKQGGMESGTVNVITVEDNENIWLGTYGGGIYKWNRNRKEYVQYAQSDGLSGNFINSIRKDKNGNFWISTSNGIDFFNSREKKFINIEPSFIFPNNDYIQNSSYGDNGHIFFFCGNRVIDIDPDKFQFIKPVDPLVISSFRVFDKETPFSSNDTVIRLSHRQNFFSFEFSALRQNPAEYVQYAYQLEGFDKDWNYTGNRGFASFTNVPGGEYTFMIKVMNSRGEWEERSKPILIIITPPFWKAWWFIFIMALAVLTALYFFYRYRIAEVKKMYSLRSKISQDLHDEVASTLSGIRLYSELAKQQLTVEDLSLVHRSLNVISENASEMKEDMSDIIWAINPANDSFGKLLKKLETYIKELTTAAGIGFKMQVNENIPSEKLNMQQRRNIYLICKEAINNAVKYASATMIGLNVQMKDHQILVSIKDNGKGFDTLKTAEGNGLLNMKLRTKEIGGIFFIDSKEGEGTHIEIKIRVR